MHASKNGDRSRCTRDFEILNRYGIHARPAALIVKLASRYDVDVFIEHGHNRVSGKSIMGLMTLEAGKGAKVRVTTEGVDAENVMSQIEKLVSDKFDEE